MLESAIQAIARSRSTPKTILGFLAGVTLIIVAGSVAAVVAFAGKSAATSYIPYVLGFDALLVLIVVVAVLTFAWKDPTRLLVGQSNTQDLIAYRDVNLGDSASGVRRETLAPPMVDVVQGTAIEDPDESTGTADSEGDPA